VDLVEALTGPVSPWAGDVASTASNDVRVSLSTQRKIITLATSEEAQKNHDELFPGHVSKLAVTEVFSTK
jgi:hypothetical protein